MADNRVFAYPFHVNRPPQSVLVTWAGYQGEDSGLVEPRIFVLPVLPQDQSNVVGESMLGPSRLPFRRQGRKQPVCHRD
jgi:hypothetical protein